MLCFGGGRKKPLSEFLEHLASDNGADMYKYNTLYTARYTQHVLSPEYLYTILSPHNFIGKLLLLISGKYIIMFS